jgi:hypothetical protein
MRFAFAAVLVFAFLVAVPGCMPAREAPPAPAPTMMPATEVSAYREAVREFYPQAIVGQVSSVDAAAGVAVISVGEADKVNSQMSVRFFGTNPLTGHGSGDIYWLDKKQSYVNLSSDATGASGAVKVGDLAAVLPQ